MNTTTETFATIESGTEVIVTKGCAARSIKKGERGTVVSVEHCERGSAYVLIRFVSQRTIGFSVQHGKHLTTRWEVGMNDGNPFHKIIIRRA